MSPDRPQMGFWLETENQPACELAASLGYELVIFDMEHGVISPRAADHLIALCKTLGLAVYSRVATGARVAIQKALDSGADGVIIPQIQNTEHARRVTAFAKYPPLGSRGVGYNRTMGYAATDTGFYERENLRCRCYPMVETPGALEEAHLIAALPTVDGLFLGPSDLSLTRGRGPNRWTQEDIADAERVIKCAQHAGKSWVMSAPSAASFDFARANGAAYVTVSDDLSALRAGFAQSLADVD